MSVRTELLSFGFDAEIADEAENIYKKINVSVSRGKKRNLKTLFCAYNAYINLDKVADIKVLAQKIGIEGNQTSKAFTLYSPFKTGYFFKKVRFSISKYVEYYINEIGLDYAIKLQISVLSKRAFKKDLISSAFQGISNQKLAIAFIIFYLKNNGLVNEVQKFKNIINRSNGSIDAIIKQISEISNNLR